MGRQYAASLGFLAATLVLMRGAIMGESVDATLLRSIVCLVIFVVVGLVLGTIAETTVVQSVRQQFEQQLAKENDQ